MKTYLVGGAVRDLMLGQEPHDRDYIVVGSTPADMLAAGYKQVGADFPVFLHPLTGAEYALARVERKTGAGYRGFSVVADGTISLEEDLIRRDLTINSMAIEFNPETEELVGDVIDPYGGMRHLKNKTLKHPGPAFAEDPLRVLRLARFAAKLPEFMIATETQRLCIEMLERGDLLGLTQERVWLETYKAFETKEPSRYFEVLKSFGAAHTVPGLRFLSYTTSEFVKHVLSSARDQDIALAYLLVGESLAASPEQATLKGLPAKVGRIAEILLMSWDDLTPEATYERFVTSGAFRGQWESIQQALSLLDSDIVERNRQAFEEAVSITASQFTDTGKALGEAIKGARIEKIRACL